MKLKSREEELDNIMRYSDFTNQMYYRSSVLTHSKRVKLIVKELCKSFSSPLINKDLALTLSIVHDDTEIIVGDVLAQHKDNFSQKEKKDYEKRCEQAIPILAEKYAKTINDFNYKELLEIEEKNDTLECALVKFADKFDAHNEVCHEITAGNKEFLKDVYVDNTPYSPYEYTYNKTIKALKHLQSFIDTSNIPLIKSIIFDEKFNKYCENGKPHTKESIELKQPLQSYQIWLDIIKKSNNKELIEKLYVKNE